MAKLTLIKRSNPVCPACNVMKAQLDGQGIEYETIDISEQPEAVEQHGLTSVPVMIIEKELGNYVKLYGVQPVDHIMELMKD